MFHGARKEGVGSGVMVFMEARPCSISAKVGARDVASISSMLSKRRKESMAYSTDSVSTALYPQV